MSYYFSTEINAPQGLVGIEKYLPHCLMALTAYQSQFNGKVILKASVDANFDFSMESHHDVLFASGEFYQDLTDAVAQLQSLHQILVNLKLPHQILLDDELGFLYQRFYYLS